MSVRRRLSLLGFVLLFGCLPVQADFKDAAVARYGREQLEFLKEFLAARPAGAKSDSVPALVASLLAAQSDESRPPMDFSALARDADLRSSLLLDYVEALYLTEQYVLAGEALDLLGAVFPAADAVRAEALRLRLALRGVGKPDLKKAAADPALGMNQALARLAEGDRAGAMRQLKAISADGRVAPPLRHRAAIWFALVAGQLEAQREVLNALDDVDGKSMLLPEGWLTALRLFSDVHPAAADAIEQALARRIPESSARWEARDYLVRTLLARGATAQAAEYSLSALNALGRSLEQLDIRLRGLSRLSITELQPLAVALPAGAKARVSELQRRNTDLRQAAELLRRWRPYLETYRTRLQRDPAKLAAELRGAVVAAKEASRNAGKAGGLADLFRLELTQLIGTPPNRDMAYRLFFGFTQWETDYEYPETWRPSFDRPAEESTGKRRRAREAVQRRQQLDRDLLPQAIDHLAQLQRKVETRVGKVPTATFRGMADRAGELAKRNVAAVQEIERVLPGFEQAIRVEIEQALQARRQVLQRWVSRFAAHVVAIHAAHKASGEQPSFELGRGFKTGNGESLVSSIRSFDDEPKRRKAGEIDVKFVWQLLAQIAASAEDRQVRADALRLRAQLTVTLYEAQSIPAVDDAVVHYQTLLRDYGDLIDRADASYQLARAQDLAQKMKDSQATLADFAQSYPADPRAGEALFRVGETHFSLGDYSAAQASYLAVLDKGNSRSRDQAEYKLAWSLFKMGEYRAALPRFMAVIDRAGDNRQPSDGRQQERLRDTFRALALTFAYLNGAPDVERYFAEAGQRPYVADIYFSLARYYLEHDRINDAAVAYDYLARQAPQDVRLPVLLADVVVGARREKLNKLALELVERFIETYALAGDYWKTAGEPARAEIRQRIQPYLADIGQMYHADAQQNRSSDSYAKAIRYYGQYIATFPQDPQSARFQFLLAEARFETADYRAALGDYEQAAYQFGAHSDASAAGYAALVANQKLADAESDPERRKRLLRELVVRSARFATAFPADSRVDPVLVKSSEDMLMLAEPVEAVTFAERLLARQPADAIKRRAWIVIAHGRFENKAFAAAESAYQEALAQKGGSPEEIVALRGRLALSIYRQAEGFRAAGNASQAIATFLRVGKTVPDAEPVPNAEIDAAVLLMESRQWATAIQVLENFQKVFPAHPLGADVPTRLAYAYENDGRLLKAADLLESLSLSEKDDALARQMAWRAGELRDKGERPDLAAATWERYLARYPAPLEKATEVRQLLSEIAARKNDQATRDRWLDQLVTEARMAPDATPRVRFLAAQAALGFGDARKAEFDAVALKLPLDKSLAAKRTALEGALRWYEETGRFGVVEKSTAATHHIGELYSRLAADIIASERPGGLNELELGQYKLLLEEEAFPFEEKAAEFHVINHQRIKNGYFDEWIARSQRALARLVPARYDRVESAGGYFDYVPPKPVKKEDGKVSVSGKTLPDEGQPATVSTGGSHAVSRP